MKTVLEVLDKCDEAARARDKMLLRDQVRELMTACGNLSETSSNESGEALATKAKELVNTVVEVFTQDFTEKSNAKLQAAINSVRNAANSVVPRGDSEKPPEFNPYDNFNDKGQLDDIYEYDPQYNPDTTFSNDGDLDGADPIYADTAHQQPISDGSDSDTSVHSDDEDLDVDATQASLGSSMRSIRKRPTINRTLSIDPEEDTADTPRATPALSKDIEYHVEVIESELDHLYSAAEVWDIKRMASTAKALFQAFSTLRKFAGHERDLPQDLERVYQSVKAASVSVTAYLHNFAQSGHSEATEPAIMDSIINLSVVMHDFIAGMRRLKFLSTVTERPAHHLMTRIQECFDVSATPHTDDKCECVDFVHCKQTLLHCSQALLSSLQQLTAAILAPCPVTWKLASICDNVAWHMQRLVHTSDLLHGGKPSPLRRLSFETCQVLLGGVALLCKPGDLTSNEFHAAVNSLHDSIPALRDSTQQLFTECFQLATNGEIRELTQKELDADIDVKVKLDLSAAHAEPEQQPDMKTVAVDGYLCTKTFKDVITSQAYQIGHIVSLSNMPRDTTIAQVKDAFTQKYDTPAAASLQLLSPEHELTDDTKLEDVVSEHDRLRVFVYEFCPHRNVEETRKELAEGNYPVPDNQPVIKLISPKEGPMTKIKKDRDVASSPKTLRTMMVRSDTAQEQLSAAAQAVVAMDKKLMIPCGSKVSRRKFKGRSRSEPAQSVMEGFLMKEGGSHKSWKLRWFVLADSELVYFKSASSETPLGLLDLADYKLCRSARLKEKSCGIELVPEKPGARVYIMSAANEEERKRWVHAIDSAIPTRRPYAQRIALLRDLIHHLQEIGGTKEDIFRVSGSEQHIKRLLHNFELRRPFNVEEIVNPYTLSGLIKKILKTCAVGPLLPASAQELMQRVVENDVADDAQLHSIRAIFNSELMTMDEHKILCDLTTLFHTVLDHAALTNTTIDEIALSFGKALFPNMADEWAHQVLHLLISHSEELFPDCPCGGSNE